MPDSQNGSPRQGESLTANEIGAGAQKTVSATMARILMTA
jgi:hypothetical protein